MSDQMPPSSASEQMPPSSASDRMAHFFSTLNKRSTEENLALEKQLVALKGKRAKLMKNRRKFRHVIRNYTSKLHSCEIELDNVEKEMVDLETQIQTTAVTSSQEMN